MLDENISLSQAQWDEIVQIWENYQLNSNLKVHSTNIRHQAIKFLRKNNKKFNRKNLRRLQAKISKLKTSQNRELKNSEDKLLKDLQRVLHE